MTVKVNHFGKMGRVEANETSAKSVKSTKSTSGKEAEKPSVFNFLLNELRSKENNQQAGSLRNKPATSEVKHDYRRTLKNPRSTKYLSTQNVNNLAASTLIALATLSSGPNRLSGMWSQGGRGACQPSGISNAGGVGASTQEVISKLCQGQEIGALSSHFESGEQGPGVVGYDPSGGTSYGTYQISSRAGTMKHFLDYLSEQAPDLASKLKSAGAANTGSASGKNARSLEKYSSRRPRPFFETSVRFHREKPLCPSPPGNFATNRPGHL